MKKYESTNTDEEDSSSKLKRASGSYSSSRSYILSFGNNENPPSVLKPKTKIVNNEQKSVIIEDGINKTDGSVTKSHHHTIAERNRREKIGQQIIALSALIPGLKKRDKATVLGDAINHMNDLQERLKLLEEQNKMKGVESVVIVKKSQLSGDQELDVSESSSNNSSDGNSDDYCSIMKLSSLPEVEARVLERSVLIRIHCEKQNAELADIVKEIEKLHLSVVNTSALNFGSSVLIITIVAQMDDEFNMNVKELARSLKVGLLQIL